MSPVNAPHSSHSPDLVALFADLPLEFVPDSRPDPTGQPWALTYHRLRHIHARIATQVPLLNEPGRLRSLLELAAMADPCLFHVMFLHHCMALGAALDYGAAPEDVAELTRGRTIGAALMTELGQGSSSANILTEAVYDPATSDFVLNTPLPEATKYPSNVGMHGIPRMAVVSARLLVAGTDRGTCLFLVPLRDRNGPCPGIRMAIRPRTALLPLDYAAVGFEQVRVPYRRWLRDGASISKDGRFHDPLEDPRARTARSLCMSRFACGAVTTGLAAAARASVSISLAHARRRVTYDRLAGSRPALAHLNQQQLLFSALATALAATVLARRATEPSWQIPRGGHHGARPAVSLMRTLSLTKVAAVQLAEHTIVRCRAACGALGFFSENRLIDYQGLVMAFHSGCGDNQLILLDAASSMAAGDDYQAPNATLSPAVQPNPQNWTSLLRTRERSFYDRLTTRLADARNAHIDPARAWHDHVDLAQRLAEAHLARTTMETLQSEWLDDTDFPSERAPFADLYRLLFLEAALANTDGRLTSGLLDAARADHIREQLKQTCRRLLPHTESLLSILDVPADVVRVPLAGDDYVRDLAPFWADNAPPGARPRSTT